MEKTFKTTNKKTFKSQYFVQSKGEFKLHYYASKKEYLEERVKEDYGVEADFNSKSSVYYFTNDSLIRISDHWGEIAGCSWTLYGQDDEDYVWKMGIIKFEDLEITKSEYLNPLSYYRLLKLGCGMVLSIVNAIREDVPEAVDEDDKLDFDLLYTKEIKDMPNTKSAMLTEYHLETGYPYIDPIFE